VDQTYQCLLRPSPSTPAGRLVQVPRRYLRLAVARSDATSEATPKAPQRHEVLLERLEALHK
ncbi:unnamed protein product, partial [Polarella glacialis]